MDNFDGMFQWVTCQLRALANCFYLAQLRKALVSLPKTLDGAYARILCNIDKQHSEYALKLLQWLTYSARPLQIRELAEVFIIDVNGSPRFDPERRSADPHSILKLCPSLIKLGSSKSKAFDDDARTNYIALAHFSMKEYLMSEKLRKGRPGASVLKD
ncbi:hypothetical protein N7G274_000130 [Stereocaulon virgatum]|uniref:GPI inositol-deacylase winged helix domain-containing protein n=1 Tax=Stereocaulon virgatum TaxID=373712 RepID=A0ABR4ART2_9LECA